MCMGVVWLECIAIVRLNCQVEAPELASSTSLGILKKVLWFQAFNLLLHPKVDDVTFPVTSSSVLHSRTLAQIDVECAYSARRRFSLILDFECQKIHRLRTRKPSLQKIMHIASGRC